MKTFATIKLGSKGTDVYILQSLLRVHMFTGRGGKPIEIDGACGEDTVYAINQFQTQQRAYGYECGTKGKNDSTFGKSCWARILGV